MLFYSPAEIVAMLAAAIIIDLLIGDPRRPVHPVIRIGEFIRILERGLYPKTAASPAGQATAIADHATGATTAPAPGANTLTADFASAPEPGSIATTGDSAAAPAPGSTAAAAGTTAAPAAGTTAHPARNPRRQRLCGVVLALTVTGAAFMAMLLVTELARFMHPWLGYAVNTWFISTTIAIKGLKDAAMQVYRPLAAGNLPEARKFIGCIVGRETERLDERGISRAAVETVAENTVDAVVSPLVFALLGAAPLAMLYRAANTLDSMVGYKNDRYRHFGWASARLDDVLNWIPARLTGILLAAAALVQSPASAWRTVRAVAVFARRHPSPNSGIPESAVAGALGVELGGRNVYGGVESERARLGWPQRELQSRDIVRTVYFLYGVSAIWLGGLLCALLVLY